MSTSPTSAETGEYTHAQVLTILSGLMLGMFLGALDQTIVSTAIRTIADDLQRAVGAGVGHDGVPDHLDDRDADLRQARRPVRPQEAVHVRDHDLHRRLGRRARSRPRCTCSRRSGPSRGSAPAACSRWCSRSSATSCRPGSGPGTRATSWRSSAPPACSDRSIGGLFAGQADSILGVTGWRWVFLVNVPIGIAALAVVARTLHLHHHAARGPHRLVGRHLAGRRAGAAAHRGRAGPGLGLGIPALPDCYVVGAVGAGRLRAGRAHAWATPR